MTLIGIVKGPKNHNRVTRFSILFQVYDGLYAIAVRDFGKAAKLFLETVSTFTSYELMDYTQFVKVSLQALITTYWNN